MIQIRDSIANAFRHRESCQIRNCIAKCVSSAAGAWPTFSECACSVSRVLFPFVRGEKKIRSVADCESFFTIGDKIFSLSTRARSLLTVASFDGGIGKSGQIWLGVGR